MAKKIILDDPANQESVLSFCRACGHETYKGQNCWDGVVSKAAYFAYRKAHPKFAEQVELACHSYTSLSKQENVIRHQRLNDDINKSLENGVMETKITYEYTCKRGKDGKPIFDANGNPQVENLVGTIKVSQTLRPVPVATKILLRDKMETKIIDI